VLRARGARRYVRAEEEEGNWDPTGGLYDNSEVGIFGFIFANLWGVIQDTLVAVCLVRTDSNRNGGGSGAGSLARPEGAYVALGSQRSGRKRLEHIAAGYSKTSGCC